MDGSKLIESFKIRRHQQGFATLDAQLSSVVQILQLKRLNPKPCLQLLLSNSYLRLNTWHSENRVASLSKQSQSQLQEQLQEPKLLFSNSYLRPNTL